MRRSTPAAIALTAALLLAGCGASGGNESSSTTAKTDTKSTSATTDGGGSTKDTTTTEAEGGSITEAALKAILPEASDIGPDYTLDEITTGGDSSDSSSDEPDATDKAMEEACPEVSKLDFGNSDGNSDEVTASFKTEDDRGFEVSLDPTPSGLEEKDLDKIVDAFNACKEIKVTEQGTDMVMTLKAEKLDGFGDFGIKVNFDLKFQMMGSDLGLQFHGYVFKANGVAVSVLATSGLDPATMAAVPADVKLLDPLSAEMEKRVGTL